MSIYNSESFVYCWTNLTNGKKYIGYHKGREDDGYICSSQSNIFWSDWQTDRWSRQIIASGTTKDCIALERKILQTIDIYSEEYYNNSICGGVIYTAEVCQKISDSKRGKKRGPFSKEWIERMSLSQTGRIHSSETKEKMSKSALKYNPGFSKQATCPKCGKQAQAANISKWHGKEGEKCKW